MLWLWSPPNNSLDLASYGLTTACMTLGLVYFDGLCTFLDCHFHVVVVTSRP